MKTRHILSTFILSSLLLLLLPGASSFTLRAQDGRSIYNEFSDLPGVSAVYISPAMFRMIKNLPELEVRSGEDEKSVNISSIIRSMKGFYLLSTEREDIVPSMKKQADKLMKKDKYELLLEVKEDGNVTRMYTIDDIKRGMVTSLIFMAAEKDDFTLILLDGEMSKKDLESLFEE